MSKISLERDFKRIVEFLPDLENACSIDFNGSLSLAPELKSTLLPYLTYYDLQNHNNKNISLTIGKLKVFNFDVVAQIYKHKDLEIAKAKGVFVFIHGYLDHFGLYNNLIKFLTDYGYIIVGIDLPGHGLSTGKIAHIVDFGQYAHSIEVLMEVIIKKYEKFNLEYSISGFSAGAAIGTEYLLRNNGNNIFNKAVWLAPLLRIPFWHYTELACYLLPFIKFVPRQSKNTSHDPSFVTFIRYNDPLQPKMVPLQWIKAMHHWVTRLPKYKPLNIPTCMIQGTEDKTIDWQRNIPNLASIYTNHQAHYVPNGYHSLCNESAEYRTKTFNYIATFLSSY